MFRRTDREKFHQLFEKHDTRRKFPNALYRDIIHQHLRPGQRILDAGCGRYMAFCKELFDAAAEVC